MSSEDEDASAMAAMMGFSAFGQQPAKKKRKFNSATDSYISGSDLEQVDRGGRKGKGSGGNQVPLGRVRVLGSGAQNIAQEVKQDKLALDDDESENGERNGGGGVLLQQGMSGQNHINGDEIDLELGMDGNSDQEELGPMYEDTSRTPPANAQAERNRNENEEDGGPVYEDTSHTPPLQHQSTDKEEVEKIEMQKRIDLLLQSIGSSAAEASTLASGNQGSLGSLLPPQQQASGLIGGEGLPNRPASSIVGDAAFMQGGGYGHGNMGHGRGGGYGSGLGTGGGRDRGGAGRAKGQRNERWYEGYYDPSFNENPWENLEKERGLEPVGKWLEKGHWRGHERRDELQT